MATDFSNIFQGTLTLLGRVSLCAIFITNAVGMNIPNFEEVVSSMTRAGVPMPRGALVLVIGVLLAGSSMIIFGWKAKVGGCLLFIYLLLSNYYFHKFWSYNDPVMYRTEMVQFFKNLSLMGAMLLIVANGSGPYSLDARSSSGFSGGKK